MATGATFQNIFFPPIPLNITGCQLWLDAADPTTVTGTTTVTQWRDKSGNGRNLSNGSGTTSYANNAITLNSSYMFVASPVNLINVTVFIVVKTTGGHNQTVFAGRPNTNVNWSSPDGFGFYMDSTSFIRYYGGEDAVGRTLSFSANTSVSTLFSFQTIGTSVSGRMNGTSQSTGTLLSARTSTAQGFSIGGEWNGSSYGNIITNASLYEIIVYNSDVTNNQRQQVEGYLAWKWGLQGNLPSDHPYKNVAPTNTPTLNTSQITTIPLTIQKNRNFTPTQISGCQFWIDALDSNSMTLSGTTVVTISDKSGNANTLSGGSGWTYNVTKFNSTYPSFYSATVGNMLGQNNSFSITSSNIILFIVGSTVENGAQSYLTDGGSSGNNRFYNYIDIAVGSEYYSNVVHGDSASGGLIRYPFTGSTVFQPFIFSQSTGTNPQTGSFNGTTFNATSGTTGSITWSGITVGGRYTNNGGLVGHICEVIIYTIALSTPQRQQVEGYLAWKWGLQANLPAGHPYKNINNNYNPFPTTTPALTRSISSIFKPTNYTGCQLWLDAWDPFGNGSRQKSPLTLTRWVDKSTNARHANMFNGSSIAYSPTAFNNRPALLFTQTQNMSSAAAAGTFPTAITFFMIYHRTGGGTYDTLVTRGVGSLAAPIDFYSNTSTGNFSRNIGNGTAQADYNTTSGSNFTNVTTPSLYYANATAASGLRDAFNFATPTDPSSGILTGVYYADNGTAIYIGTRADSVTKLTASVAEVIVYSTTPTDIQRQTIEGYLAWKWGLVASLPASHPYKNYPPPPQ